MLCDGLEGWDGGREDQEGRDIYIYIYIYIYTHTCRWGFAGSSDSKEISCSNVLMRWMKLEPIIQSEVSQKEKHQYSILMHIYGI